jgi:hypothetical protein
MENLRDYTGCKTFTLSGNTFPVSAKIRKAGGRWNPAAKVWTIEIYRDSTVWRLIEDGVIFKEKLTASQAKATKEQAHDDLYNEGLEGYNPHR